MRNANNVIMGSTSTTNIFMFHYRNEFLCFIIINYFIMRDNLEKLARIYSFPSLVPYTALIAKHKTVLYV